MAGWIKLWRKLLENGHLKMPGMAFKLWIYCLLEAAPYPDPKTGLTVGELWLSYQGLRDNLGEGNRKVSMSTVSAALKYLEQNGYITLQSEKFKGIKARIINWGEYQALTSKGTEEKAEIYTNALFNPKSNRLTDSPTTLSLAEAKFTTPLSAAKTNLMTAQSPLDLKPEPPTTPPVIESGFTFAQEVIRSDIPSGPPIIVPHSLTPQITSPQSPTPKITDPYSPSPKTSVPHSPAAHKVAETDSPTPFFGGESDSMTTRQVAANASPTTLQVANDYSQSSRLTTPTVITRTSHPYSHKASSSNKNTIENDIKNINSIVVVRVAKDFVKEFGRPLSPIEMKQLANWLQTVSEDLIKEALTRASLQDKRSIAYVGGILKNWSRAGITTVDEILRESTKTSSKGGKKNARSKPVKPGYHPHEVDWDNEPDTL